MNYQEIDQGLNSINIMRLKPHSQLFNLIYFLTIFISRSSPTIQYYRAHDDAGKKLLNWITSFSLASICILLIFLHHDNDLFPQKHSLIMIDWRWWIYEFIKKRYLWLLLNSIYTISFYGWNFLIAPLHIIKELAVNIKEFLTN